MTNMTASSKSGLADRLIPMLVIVSVVLAFGVGILWQRVSNLEGGKVLPSTSGTAGTNPAAPAGAGAAAPAGPTAGKLSADQASKFAEVTDEDHIRGNRNAKVFLVEYSDLECPFCARFHPTTQQVIDEYGGDVALVFRDFPLDQLHPRARPAAIGAECVASLGGEDAYWSYVDAIFADQSTTLSDLGSVASSAGVNESAFQTCLDSEEFAAEVEEDYQSGLAVGVTGTPGNIIVNQNGGIWLVPGALPFEQIKVTIDEALQG